MLKVAVIILLVVFSYSVIISLMDIPLDVSHLMSHYSNLKSFKKY